MSEPDGRTHEPTLRELVAAFDGFRQVMDERDRLYLEKFKSSEDKTVMALGFSKEAVTKADTATEKRFEGVNEFRKSLSDQTVNFLSKSEAEPRFSAIDARVTILERSNNQSSGRAGGISATLMAVVIASGVVSGLVFGILQFVLKK